MVRTATTVPVGGLLTIDRAAYDPVESSWRAFERASELLYRVLVAVSQGRDRDTVMPVLVADLAD
jgi:hypothetical protein